MKSATTLKVVHLSSSHYADDARILHKECRSLAKAGHDVTLVARNRTDAVVHGVKIRALHSDPAKKWQRWTGAVWRAYREASRLDADVYHFHDPELIPVGVWLSVSGKRVVYDAHEDLPKTFAYKHYLPRFAREGLGWLAGKIEDLAVRRFAGVVAATPGIAKRFFLQNKNTVLVRNFPVLEELGKAARIPWNQRPDLVAYIGSTGPERGIRECVEAMALLPKELNARLAIAGPLSSALRQQVDELKGRDQTELLGILGRGEVAELLSRTRVGLVPLHRMPNFINSLPVKMFEYMSAAIPVVVSDFPLLRKIVETHECGLLVDPPSEANLAGAIEYLLTHHEEAQRMGERGRKAIESFHSWKSEERQLLSFYESLATKGLVCSSNQSLRNPVPARDTSREDVSLQPVGRGSHKNEKTGTIASSETPSLPIAAISKMARLWAIRELARRAGVTKDFFDSWKVEITPLATILHVQPGTTKQICFRNINAENGDHLASRRFHTLRAAWMRSPPQPVIECVPDLIVPFCEAESSAKQPLFQQADVDRIVCFVDLPASTLFCLCRVEETQHHERDVHSRFTAGMSVAQRDGFLDRPVVDEWGLAFAQALEALVPGWHPKPRLFRAKISHDVDDIGRGTFPWPNRLKGDMLRFGRIAWMALPFDLRNGIKMSYENRAPIHGMRYLWNVTERDQPSCLELVAFVSDLVRKHGLNSAVYWKASSLAAFDSGYDPRHPKVRAMICRLQEKGVENGVHPGYQTFKSVRQLEEELKVLREVIGASQLGGRQHYLRWCPDTWIDWENCGLAYDSTVGYADTAGFRAGTCIPYHPWLLPLNRESHLLEIPLLAMDTSLLDYMHLRGEALPAEVQDLIHKARAVGGVFTFLCHGTSMRDASFVRQFEQILGQLDSATAFDWKSHCEDPWLC